MPQIIIGLIILVLIAKYWNLIVGLGIVGLVIWFVAKFLKTAKTVIGPADKSSSELHLRITCDANDDPPPRTMNINLPGPESEFSSNQKLTCAYCRTEGMYTVLKSTDKTIDLRCYACGKNFFIHESNSNNTASDHQSSSPPPYSTSQPNRCDTTIFGARAQQLSVSPDSVWVPSGRTIQVTGRALPGGLLYFGSGLKSVSGWSEEPALLDPKLPIDNAHPDREGRYMGYWPPYSQINPASRAAFIEWLASGRKEPKTDIGYVFIYFYGLERRALADVKNSAAARNDVSAIITEVKRLLSIYGENASFHGYASKFLDALQITQAAAPLYRSSPQIESPSWEFPLTLKIALGQIARDGIPVSVEWALAWAEHDPSMPRRMPVQRCPEEFRELFKLHYAEKFGDGLKLKPNKTRIQATYRPASSSFSGQVEIPLPDLPDITRTTGPTSKISELVTVCTDELEGYSRYLGRNPEGRNSIEATSYLPQILLKNHVGKEFQKLYGWLADQFSPDVPVSVPFNSLLKQIPSIKQSDLGKKEATVIANLLGKMQIGMEPDPRFGSFVPKPEQDIVLFRIGDNAPNCPSSEYSVATVVLHLAAAVAAADGMVGPNEERHLEKHLDSWLHLSPDEKTRLRAHTQWLLSSFPGISGVKKRVELLRQEQRESLGRFLVAVAHADGYIDASEMKILTKIYEMLGLDTQSLCSHAHAAAIEPVTVQAADLLKPQGYTVPLPPAKATTGLSLDMGSIEAKLAETAAVSAILNNIFTEEEPGTLHVGVAELTAPCVPIPGLDPEAYLFMQVLASRQAWAREELEKLAADHGLMLDGTLDSINDAAFDHFGGPLFEGDDPIEIDQDIVSRLEV